MATSGTDIARVHPRSALAERWARSLERHTKRVEVLERAVVALMDGELNDELRELARSEAHSLAGSIDTFGLRNGMRLARALEQSFGAPQTLGRVFASRLADQVLALRRELERSPAFDEIVAGHGPHRRLMLVSNDLDRAEDYLAEGFARGFAVEIAPAEDIAGAAASTDADAMVIEIREDDLDAGIALLSELARREVRRPTLVVSSADGMELRLAIVRAGALGPLPLAHPAAEVLQRAAPLLDAPALSPASILVVNSDLESLRVTCRSLGQAGHTVHAVTDPRRFWEKLESVSPNLVVASTSMSSVSGLDLTRALRADPRWRELPIVLIAAGDDTRRVEQAYLAGADDVISGPIDQHVVTGRIAHRLVRSRLLRGSADSDALTGLANRRKAEWDLGRFLRLARRHRHPVSLIVFRFDGLAHVTSVHGHATSEHAMRWFSQLLRRSFRAEDVVSRWGADDFVVGLFDAATDSAMVRAREVMASLHEHRFTTPAGGTASFTCSVGIATFPLDAGDPSTLYSSADAALVAAQRLTPHEAFGVASNPYARLTGRVDVVLIENDPAIAGIVIHALESREYVVRWLRHGHEAAAALLGEAPELRTRLVLMEVNLPAFDGLSILRALAEEGKLRHTKAILLTVRSTEAEVLQAFELGAFDHVPKPFSVSVLMARVRRALAS